MVTDKQIHPLIVTSLTDWHSPPPPNPLKNTWRLLLFNVTLLKHRAGKPRLVLVEGGGGYKSDMFSQAWQSPCINHLALQLKTGLASLCINKATSKQHSSRKCSLVNSNELWVLGFSLFSCACLESEFLGGFGVFWSGAMSGYVCVESLLPDWSRWHFPFCVLVHDVVRISDSFRQAYDYRLISSPSPTLSPWEMIAYSKDLPEELTLTDWTWVSKILKNINRFTTRKGSKVGYNDAKLYLYRCLSRRMH